MDVKDLKSSSNVIKALGEFSGEIMELMHKAKNLPEDEECELRETLAEIHQLMARIGYSSS